MKHTYKSSLFVLVLTALVLASCSSDQAPVSNSATMMDREATAEPSSQVPLSGEPSAKPYALLEGYELPPSTTSGSPGRLSGLKRVYISKPVYSD